MFILFKMGTAPLIALTTQATISGTGGSVTFNSGLLGIDSSWLSTTTLIDESIWNVTSGTWSGLIANVTELSIKIELVDGVNDIEGIDNISLTNVPLPSSLLLVTGLIGIGRFATKT